MADQTSLSLHINDDIPIIIDNIGNSSCQFKDDDIVILQKFKRIKFSTKFYNFDDVSEWGKCLVNMPVFTIREIVCHRQLIGKTKGLPIAKTLDKGRKFKNERYISSNSIFTYFVDDKFMVKSKCKASMKNEFRNVNVI